MLKYITNPFSKISSKFITPSLETNIITPVINKARAGVVINIPENHEFFQIGVSETGGVNYIVRKKHINTEQLDTKVECLALQKKFSSWDRIEDINKKSDSLLKLGKTAAVVGGTVVTGITLVAVHKDVKTDQAITSCPKLSKISNTSPRSDTGTDL